MATIAPARDRQCRFFLDGHDFLGALFLAPAILYIARWSRLPFFLALYYSLSAYSIGNPSYLFVGLRQLLSP